MKSFRGGREAVVVAAFRHRPRCRSPDRGDLDQTEQTLVDRNQTASNEDRLGAEIGQRLADQD